jgi:signal transduction histidine kinase/ActR/RegA family two-component response regulator
MEDLKRVELEKELEQARKEIAHYKKISEKTGNLFLRETEELSKIILWRKQAEKEKEKLQARIQQSQKIEAIGTLAGGIAHDFNNILGIILGNTELALDNLTTGKSNLLNLEEIQSACLRAKDIVRQLLSFARNTEPKRNPINMVEVVEDSLKLLRATIPSNIEIRCNIQAKNHTISADATQIHQVMINLCTNAFHAMEETGGFLDIIIENVSLEKESRASHSSLALGNYIKLTVRDTGHGISSEVKSQIFDPYFTTKGVGKGTGMGLSVVHGIVKNHGGEISVDSEPQKGTAVLIYFPVIEEEAPVEETEIAEELPVGNERILFVDDDESNVYLGRKRLERLGYQVETKMNPLEALDLFQTTPDHFDLLITDMTMPDMSGDQLVKEILKLRPDMPAILCSGFNEKIDEKKAAEIGIRQYIEKPYDNRFMAKIVRKVLDEK